MNHWLKILLRLPHGVRRESAERYVRSLEEQLERERAEVARERVEIVRLREENRAMLNSLLGTAGVPPVETRREYPQVVSAVRRRSWPQIATTREIEAARQVRSKPQTTTGE